MTTAKKILIVLGIIVALFAAAYFIFGKEPIPTGKSGNAADSLAQEMLRAINHQKWEETEAISWNFKGVHQLLWDKRRKLAKVDWDDYSALSNCHNRGGIVYQDGKEIQDSSLLEKAYFLWANDSYWLNPISKIMEPVVNRKLVKHKGEDALLVTYESGGVTPGDTYLWILDENNRPTSWKMWVSIVPIEGAEVTWEKWEQCQTGVWFSTLHNMGPMEITVSDLKCANKLEDISNGKDVFSVLVDRKIYQP